MATTVRAVCNSKSNIIFCGIITKILFLQKKRCTDQTLYPSVMYVVCNECNYIGLDIANFMQRLGKMEGFKAFNSQTLLFLHTIVTQALQQCNNV